MHFYNKMRIENGWSKYRAIINLRADVLSHRSYTSVYDKFVKMFPNEKEKNGKA